VRCVALCVLLLAACSTKKRDQPATAATADVEPAKPASRLPPAGGCAISLELRAETIRLSGETLQATEVPRTPGSAPELPQLVPLAGTCAANIKAAPETSYRDVVLVMERLHRIGIKDMWLGDHAKPPAPPADHWQPNALSPGGPGGDLKPTPPIIIVTPAEVTLGDRTIGKVGGAFESALTSALPPHPADPTIILRADPGLTYGTIRQVIDAAHAAGYTNVVFEVPAN
jgi:biopolymer transport protein ExbD